MAEAPNSPEYDPGIVFTEVAPRTFHALFTRYDRDQKANAMQGRYYLLQARSFIDRYPGKKINFINDTSQIGGVTYLSNEARAAYLEAYAMPQVGKVAMVGFNTWLKSLVVFFAQFASRTGAQTRFFDTKEEAISWITKDE